MPSFHRPPSLLAGRSHIHLTPRTSHPPHLGCTLAPLAYTTSSYLGLAVFKPLFLALFLLPRRPHLHSSGLTACTFPRLTLRLERHRKVRRHPLPRARTMALVASSHILSHIPLLVSWYCHGDLFGHSVVPCHLSSTLTPLHTLLLHMAWPGHTIFLQYLLSQRQFSSYHPRLPPASSLLLPPTSSLSHYLVLHISPQPFLTFSSHAHFIDNHLLTASAPVHSSHPSARLKIAFCIHLAPLALPDITRPTLCSTLYSTVYALHHLLYLASSVLSCFAILPQLTQLVSCCTRAVADEVFLTRPT